MDHLPLPPHGQVHDLAGLAVIQQRQEAGHVAHSLPIQGDDHIARIDRVSPSEARPAQAGPCRGPAGTDTRNGSSSTPSWRAIARLRFSSVWTPRLGEA